MATHRVAGTPTAPGMKKEWEWKATDQVVAFHLLRSTNKVMMCASCRTSIQPTVPSYRYAVRRGNQLIVVREHAACASAIPDRRFATLLLTTKPEAADD